MERLTVRNSDGAWDVPLRDDDGVYIPSQEVIDRLAAYEDTGLEPETIKNWMLTQNLIDSGITPALIGTPLKHLFELAKAEAEGHLLVLLCKVGDTVYLPHKNDWGDLFSFEVIEVGVDRDGPFFVIDDEEHDHISMSDIGADVFLSREEAEEALAKEAMANGY